MEKLFRGKDLRAIRLCPKPDTTDQTLFITFSNFRRTPSLQDDGFGQDFLSKTGIAAIHVICAGNTWFQSPEVLQLAQAVLPARRHFAKAVGYGSSMGGFGAMMFSKLLNLDATLTISPQYSIQPHKVEGDSRWAHIARQLDFVFDDMDAGLSKTANHTLFYDPCTADDIHARLYEKKGVTSFALPYSGHSSAGYLQQVGVLSKLVTKAANDPTGEFDALHQMALERSARSALYAQNVKQAAAS